jgi:hypothetical protein
MILLIEYNRARAIIGGIRQFAESNVLEPLRSVLAREIELRSQAIGDQEVVLLEAEDEAALRKTHARYFSPAEELGRSAIAELQRSTP